MINIKDWRVCLKCWLSKRWEFYYEKPGSKFGYQSTCKGCVDAAQKARRLLEWSTPPVSDVIKPFKLITPKVPEKIIPLRTDRNDYSPIVNYWENDKKFWEISRIWSGPISALYEHI